MLLNKAHLISYSLIAFFALIGLTSCHQEKDKPNFSGYEKIAELATLECTYHNVAEIYDDGTDVLFGINVGYKKAWFEYDGTIRLGVDASKIDIDEPDVNNVIKVFVPKAQVIGIPDADEKSFSDIYSDTGLLTPITAVDQSKAYAEAQAKMKESAENNPTLMNGAYERAKALLKQYIYNVGKASGEQYEVMFVDAE